MGFESFDVNEDVTDSKLGVIMYRPNRSASRQAGLNRAVCRLHRDSLLLSTFHHMNTIFLTPKVDLTSPCLTFLCFLTQEILLSSHNMFL